MNNKQTVLNINDYHRKIRKQKNDPAFTDRALTVDEVAEKFNVSRRTIYRMAKQDGFPKRRYISKAVVRFMESELDVWLSQQGNKS